MHIEKKPNALVHEKSPYLLQHAYNPVNWYPWSEEALRKAKDENKPIFLSIGYSTCHWCHVMERESFEDEQVAAMLNANYVSIKVDREERPDIDAIYMAVCQALTGQGGWPLSIWMTPDQKPFYAGTYFPKSQKQGRLGMMEILPQISSLWTKEPERLTQVSEEVVKELELKFYRPSPGELPDDIFAKAYQHYKTNFDPTYGGFGGAPKFPAPHNLMFLLRYWYETGEENALAMVEKTLEAMYQGGIFDHIGGGFSRYATDNRWLIPHFEKMLYDNALLAIAYLECFQATNNPFYADVAEEIFSYVLRDMTGVDGEFYSAEDADSEGVEGKFYLWEYEEVFQILGEKAAPFCATYGISASGNFEGKSIPNLIGRNPETAKAFNEEREALFTHRQGRIPPYKDDKVLTAWNGMMIAALALGARVLHKEAYLTAAKKGATFVHSKLRREDGRLFVRYREGEAANLGFLDDYVYYILGLIETHQSCYDPWFLQQAEYFAKEMIRLFWDEDHGGFYLSGSDHETLISRPKESYDGAVPSGNSAAAVVLSKLSALTGDDYYKTYALQQTEAFGKTIERIPAGYPYFLNAVLLQRTSSTEVHIVGDRQSEQTNAFIRVAQEGFYPDRFIRVSTEEQGERKMVDGQATAYVCKDYTCLPPIVEIEKLTAQLK